MFDFSQPDYRDIIKVANAWESIPRNLNFALRYGKPKPGVLVFLQANDKQK